MKSAKIAFGEFEKLLIAFLCSVLAFLMFKLPVREFFSFLAVEVPFKGLAVVGGFTIVFWISLAYRLCGKYYGIATALLVASLCLIANPWFNIYTPEWFSIYGLISFLFLGILTEKLNGGFGFSGFILVNWVALAIHHSIFFSPVLGAVFLVISFLSGLAGNKIAFFIVDRLA